jgi:hypothetical protein
LSNWIYKLGLRLHSIRWIRNAIDQRADLSEFRKPPTPRTVVGVVLIALSFLMCWPAIAALGAIALHYRRPLLFVIGSPALYWVSHLVYLLGIWLSGQKYPRIFFKWAMRRWVERLLSYGNVESRVEKNEANVT